MFNIASPAGTWVERVRLEFGDYGTDQGIVKMEGTGPNSSYFHDMTHWAGSLASGHGVLDSEGWAGRFDSFIAMGEGLRQNSVFWDNIRLTVVPSHSGAVIGLVAACAAAGRRRGRITASS